MKRGTSFLYLLSLVLLSQACVAGYPYFVDGEVFQFDYVGEKPLGDGNFDALEDATEVTTTYCLPIPSPAGPLDEVIKKALKESSADFLADVTIRADAPLFGKRCLELRGRVLKLPKAGSS